MNRFSTAEVVLRALHEVHMQHLDEGTIHAWLDDALPGDEVASVAKHVDECRDCAALVAEARGMIVAAGNVVASLDNVRGGVIPAPLATRMATGQGSLWRRLHLTPTRAALAATLLIAVGSVLTARYAGVDHRRSASEMIAMSSAAPGPSAVTPIAPPVQAQAAASEMQKTAPAAPSAATVAPQPAPAASPRQERASLDAVAKSPNKYAEVRKPSDSTTGIVADRVAAAAAAPVPAATANLPVAAPAAAGSTPQAARVSGDSTRAASSEQRRNQVAPLEQIAVTGARAIRFANTGVEGCYEVRVDSASSSATPGILPRFELTRNSGTAQNVVRSVTPEGQVDSVVPGGSWERVTPSVVRIRFAAAREEQPFTLQLDAGRLTGRAGAGDRVTNVPVRRIDCRR